VLERADKLWRKDIWAGPGGRLAEEPSRYMRQVYGCFYDDLTGLASRDAIGVDRITFETDYPHQDSTWPATVDTVRSFADQLDAAELELILRGNARVLLRL
jgi:hypothetical protein